ncbi:MAG: adenine deaminase [Anaerolineae bacterium]
MNHKVDRSMQMPFPYSATERAHAVEVALGRVEPDLVIRNCRALAVQTGEWIATNLLVAGDRIAAWSENVRSGRRIVDAGGRRAIPGLIDGHMHVEATLLAPSRLATLLVPRGVTTILADLHEVVHVFGLQGVEAFTADAARTPLRCLLQVPSPLRVAEVKVLLGSQQAVSLGEASLPRILRKLDKFTRLAEAAQAMGRGVTGHAAGLELGPELAALTALGQADDHECETPEQALARLRFGQRVMIREGSAARNLKALLPLLRDHPTWADRFTFCTDDRDVMDILYRGHLDDCVRTAIQEGVAPEIALRVATLSCAEQYHLEAHLGSLAPGRLADVVLLEDLETLTPYRVIVGGEVVAEKRMALWPDVTPAFPSDFFRSVRVGRKLTPDDLALHPPEGGESVARVIRVAPDRITKEVEEIPVRVRDGEILDRVTQDILKIVVVERHRATGEIGLGLVQGFGLRRGALASSVAHDDHNLVAVGTQVEDMLVALRTLESLQGGLVVVEEGRVRAALPLPIAGLINPAAPSKVAQQLKRVVNAAHDLGCTLPAPFMTLSFVPLVGLPELGLSEKGLIDSKTYESLSLWVRD